MIQKPESDVEELFGPLLLLIGLGLVFYGVGTNSYGALIAGLACLVSSGIFFLMLYDIHVHPEKWKRAR